MKIQANQTDCFNTILVDSNSSCDNSTTYFFFVLYDLLELEIFLRDGVRFPFEFAIELQHHNIVIQVVKFP